VALAHGTNDAQKTMGVITLTLIAAGLQESGSGPEFWVVVSCAFAIAIGTYSGGWRIIKTMGHGLTAVKPAQGFAAETSTAATILASSHLGFALSTTQVASGSVIGSGLGRRGASVRWGTARRILVGWLLTLPAAALVGGLAALLALTGTVGIVIDAVLGVAFILGIFVLSRSERVDRASLEKEVNAAGQAVKIKKSKSRSRA
jgi:PiT family inorganic phosphate transporter